MTVHELSGDHWHRLRTRNQFFCWHGTIGIG
ncbi:hypothetical protein ACVIWU_006455 [Bradyrhizobium sp. USDA 4509]